MKDRIPDYTWSGRRSFYQEQSTDFVEEPEVDELWSEVVALLNFDGDDGDTTTTDSGPNGLTVSMAGGAEIDDEQSMFGGTALLFPGSPNNGANIAAPAGTFRPDVAITMEFWWRPAAVDTLQTLGGIRTASDGWAIYQLDDGKINVQGFNTSVQIFTITASIANVIDTWYLISITRTVGGFWTMWRDGIDIANTTESDVVGDSGTSWQMGYDLSTAGRDANGWIDDFRYTRGTDRYTEPFDVPTATWKTG